jgi:hypothetical protein
MANYFIPDWLIVSGLILWIAPFFLAPLVQRMLEHRPRLISYLLHPSAVTVHPPNGSAVLVHLHAIVIRNDGKKPAVNVRVGHASLLPDHTVYPDVQRSIIDLPGGGKEILFPVLVPGEQITIQYLYFAPVQWQQINTHAKSDEGLAKILNVLPTPQPSKATKYLAGGLMFIGLMTVLYSLLLLITLAAHAHNRALSQLPATQGNVVPLK